MRFAPRLFSCLLLWMALLSVPANAQTTAKLNIPRPATDVPTSGSWVLSPSQLIYVLADPLMGGRNDPNHGRYFKDFRLKFFLVNLHPQAGRFMPSTPRLLFTGPQGAEIGLGSLARGWLVYIQTAAYYDPGGTWSVIAYNVDTGARVVLDTRDREGVASLNPAPRTDGHTVVWQSYTRVRGKVTSVIRSYDLATGHYRILAHGGSSSTWVYYDAQVSGRWVVTERDDFKHQRSQIMLVDLRTDAIRGLTSSAAANSEPTVAGDIVAWKVGWRFGNARGIAVRNLRSRTQKFIPDAGAEAPAAVANGYVAFSSRVGTPHVSLYDDRRGVVRTIVPADDHGYRTGGDVRVAGNLVSYTEGLPCNSPKLVCPGRFVVSRIP